MVELLLEFFKAGDAEMVEAIPVPAFFEVDHEGTVNPVTVDAFGVGAFIVD